MNTFQKIWGNQRLLGQLRQATKNEKVSHAYLLHGAAGCGKKMIANTFAKYLQCEKHAEEPCGVCKSCRAFDGGNHPDVIWVRTEKKSLGVDEVREQVLESVEVKPYAYRYKIYVIDKADRLTIQAQNALLKTLEEPPIYAIFILLAEQTDNFLPTILSRVIALKIPPLGEKTISDYLRTVKNVDEELLGLYASYAQGSIGQALELVENEEFRSLREEIMQMLERLPQASYAEVLATIKELEKYKNDWRFLDMMELWYRDAMIAKSLRQEEFLLQQDMKQALFRLAGATSMDALAKKAEAVQKARTRLMQNANFRLTIEIMLFEIKENEGK